MQEAMQAFKQHGSKTAAADALGVNRGTYNHRLMRAIAAGLDEDIVHAAPAGHVVKGVSTQYSGDGTIISQWVKTKAGQPSFEEITEAIAGAFEEYRGTAEIAEPPVSSEPELATVYPLADWHIGLLAWHREVEQDWDLTIAEAAIGKAMERLVARSPASETAVVLGLGDLLHADNYDNMTARSGHKLDVDGRYPKVLKVATKLVVHTIELALRKHQTVIVRLLPGNHDDQSAIAVSLALALRYEGHPRVKVDDDPSRFWWWRWGKTFLGAAHGDMAKMDKLPLIMASRHPEDWGASEHRFIMTGHIHHREKLNAREFAGVTVESFNSPAGKDAWQHGAGFVSGQCVNSLTFHNVEGELSRSRVNIVTS
jgi:hypothetical protein